MTRRDYMIGLWKLQTEYEEATDYLVSQDIELKIIQWRSKWYKENREKDE